ncbi:gamma-glutamylcyclotransferase [Microvirga sp. 2MCAF38]|uniref:gamma-glutamylcyclotransferase n=1 Tax=Microvirga sp. 2MCAF38 TaxID=3232989 RepID=UPI003F979AA5
MTDEIGDLWVFGYGSLMWRPGFPFEERRHAHLHGYHRSLCVLSHVHRGTPEKPGLVLGLDRGGRCHGVAFRVMPQEAEATVDYLREREQVTSVYLERHLPVRLDDGRSVTALAYIVDRNHPQYTRRPRLEDVLPLVRQGHGVSGPNTEYVRSTHDHLVAMGVTDLLLDQVVRALA